MTDYDGLGETFSENLKQTAERFELGVNSWMDVGGRKNPAVWVEETAIIMQDQTESELGADYEVVNIAQLEDLEDESNYSAESDLVGLLEEQEVDYWEKLRDVIGEMDSYTDISSYLNGKGIVLSQVNNGLVDGLMRGPESREDY